MPAHLGWLFYFRSKEEPIQDATQQTNLGEFSAEHHDKHVASEFILPFGPASHSSRLWREK